MAASLADRTLLKILIATAWLDGRIQPQERQHLYRLAHQQGLADDPEIRPLLYELKPVTKRQCYDWVHQYLGGHPSPATCQALLAAVSALVYSDGEVATEEARLLSSLQHTVESGPLTHLYEHLLYELQGLYRRWINSAPD